jgi:hypothetical protein
MASPVVLYFDPAVAGAGSGPTPSSIPAGTWEKDTLSLRGHPRIATWTPDDILQRLLPAQSRISETACSRQLLLVLWMRTKVDGPMEIPPRRSVPCHLD